MIPNNIKSVLRVLLVASKVFEKIMPNQMSQYACKTLYLWLQKRSKHSTATGIFKGIWKFMLDQNDCLCSTHGSLKSL